MNASLLLSGSLPSHEKNGKHISIKDSCHPNSFGLHKMHTKGGHEAGKRKELRRTIIIQTHVDPLSELVMRTTINDLGVTCEEFIAMLESL